MATKKRPAAKKRATARTSVKAGAKRKQSPASMDARIRELENRLRELERNTVPGLGEVLTLEKGRRCHTLKLVGNLQIINGAGRTNTVNGCGNLIIGYNEPRPTPGIPEGRSGSHNLILGRYHSYASYACLLSGEMNTATADAVASCVVGGMEGSANADKCVIVGGIEGKANSGRCVIIGGFDNGANNADRAVVIGGTNNRADAANSCIFGGGANTTSGAGSTILGGNNLATTLPGERIPP